MSSVMGLYVGGDEAGAMGDDIVGGGDDTDSDSGTVGAEIVAGVAKIVAGGGSGTTGAEIVAGDEID